MGEAAEHHGVDYERGEKFYFQLLRVMACS
jgi:hypothetical protein